MREHRFRGDLLSRPKLTLKRRLKRLTCISFVADARLDFQINQKLQQIIQAGARQSNTNLRFLDLSAAYAGSFPKSLRSAVTGQLGQFYSNCRIHHLDFSFEGRECFCNHINGRPFSALGKPGFDDQSQCAHGCHRHHAEVRSSFRLRPHLAKRVK